MTLQAGALANSAAFQGRNRAGQDRIGAGEAVVGARADHGRATVDQVAVGVGELVVDEQQRERIGHGPTVSERPGVPPIR